MFASNANLFRRYEHEQLRLLRATMPKSGVVEYDSFIPAVALTGRVWRAGSAVLLPRKQHEAIR